MNSYCSILMNEQLTTYHWTKTDCCMSMHYTQTAQCQWMNIVQRQWTNIALNQWTNIVVHRWTTLIAPHKWTNTENSVPHRNTENSVPSKNSFITYIRGRSNGSATTVDMHLSTSTKQRWRKEQWEKVWCMRSNWCSHHDFSSVCMQAKLFKFLKRKRNNLFLRPLLQDSNPTAPHHHP